MSEQPKQQDVDNPTIEEADPDGKGISIGSGEPNTFEPEEEPDAE